MEEKTSDDVFDLVASAVQNPLHLNIEYNENRSRLENIKLNSEITTILGRNNNNVETGVLYGTIFKNNT